MTQENWIEKVDPNFAQPGVQGDLQWHDISAWGVEGRGWDDVESYYDRLPAKAHGMVRPAVWDRLSHHSSGMCVRFVTDAPAISARWRLRFPDLALPHMPATGVSGLDLYTRADKLLWRWAGVGKPERQNNDSCLVTGLDPGRREYMLYLPLYNGVERVAVGVDKNAFIAPAPPRRASRRRPICFYGTSITQGGCASRPGMAYPAIIGRRLDWPFINLGFSGNGKAEPEMAELLAELDPALYVLDCLTNMDEESVAERIEFMVKTLRAGHPLTPIVIVECVRRTNEGVVAEKRNIASVRTLAMHEAFDRLIAQGVERLYVVREERLTGSDGEGTVDSMHATDLGFSRMADALTPVLNALL